MNRTYSGAVKELSELNSFNPELSDVIELTSRQIKLGTSFMEIKSNLNFLGFTHRKADEIIFLAQNKNRNKSNEGYFKLKKRKIPLLKLFSLIAVFGLIYIHFFVMPLPKIISNPSALILLK